MFNIDREKITGAFNEYVSNYDATNTMIALKITHTYKVAHNCEQIANSLNLEKDEVDFAWLSGMLHDIGRFEQYVRYKTFYDLKSIDHAEFGADLLFKDGLIRNYIDDNRYDDLLDIVIRQHNKYKIDSSLDERTKMFCDILRDADKVDIFRVNIETPILELYNTTEDILYNSSVSEDVMKQIREHHAVDRAVCITPADKYLGHIALCFELVFKESWNIVREHKYLESMYDFKTLNPDTQNCLIILQDEVELHYNMFMKN